MRPGAGELLQAKQKELDAFQRLLRILERLRAEVQFRAMRNRKQRVAQRQRRVAHLLDLGKRIDVSQRLGNLLLVNIQMLAMDPVADEGLPGGPFALRDLILVMWKNQIDRTGVNVERLAEKLH